MSDENDGSGEENNDGTDSAPKGLRDKLKAVEKQNADMLTELADLRKQNRKTSVAEALKTHNAREGLAEFYNADDTSADAVKAWLEKNSENFGWSAQVSGAGDEGIDQDTIDQAQRIRAVANESRAKDIPNLMEKLQTGTIEDLIREGLIPDMHQ